MSESPGCEIAHRTMDKRDHDERIRPLPGGNHHNVNNVSFTCLVQRASLRANMLQWTDSARKLLDFYGGKESSLTVSMAYTVLLQPRTYLR